MIGIANERTRGHEEMSKVRAVGGPTGEIGWRVGLRTRSIIGAVAIAVCAVLLPAVRPVSSAYAVTPKAALIYLQLDSDVVHQTTDRLKRWDCLTVANQGSDLVPSGWAWGSGAAGQPYCGWSSPADQLANGQSAWVASWIRAGLEPDESMWVLESKATGKCLVSDWNGDTSRPQLVRFEGTGPYCGATEDQILRDPRALWDLYPSRSGSTGPIRSVKTNKCLIFGNRGGDVYTSMYRWNSPDGSYRFCGLSRSDLGRTGQATYSVNLLGFVSP
jgi:hypothetical protein